MKLKIEFAMDNAAFDPPCEEAARILREIADDIQNGKWNRPVMDLNGNQVGECRVRGHTKDLDQS